VPDLLGDIIGLQISGSADYAKDIEQLRILVMH